MSFGDLTRVNTNLQAMGALKTLQSTNASLGDRQMRLATGSRLNKAEDDSAGYSIAKKLEAKVRGQAQALSNVGDAKSMLTVAEGSLNSTMDILQTMKEKTVQAANDTMGTQERAAIQSQLTALTSEINDTLTGTTFNGTDLFAGGASTGFSFQVNAESGDTFRVSLGAIGTTSLGTAGAGSAATGVALASLDVATSGTTRDTAITAVDNAINQVTNALAGLGDSQKRLSFKQENLTTSMNNYEGARSRIADADFAKEQMEIVKLQILQQTGTSALAQGNSAPQSVLSLF